DRSWACDRAANAARSIGRGADHIADGRRPPRGEPTTRWPTAGDHTRAADDGGAWCGRSSPNSGRPPANSGESVARATRAGVNAAPRHARGGGPDATAAQARPKDSRPCVEVGRPSRRASWRVTVRGPPTDQLDLEARRVYLTDAARPS